MARPTVLISPDGAELTRGFVRDPRAGGVRLMVDRAMTRLAGRSS